MLQPSAEAERLAVVQPLAVLVGDESLAQVKQRKNASAMRGIGDPRMVQSRDKIASTKIALGLWRQR